RPLPHIPAQLLHPIWTGALWEAPYSTRCVDSCSAIIGAVRVRIVAPGISPSICTASRLLPFCLARQGDLPPFLAQQAGEGFWRLWPLPQARCEPVAIGHCIVPGHIRYRVIREQLTQPLCMLWPITARLHESTKLRHSHGIASDVIAGQVHLVLMFLVFKGISITGPVASHLERPRWNLRKAQQGLIWQIPGIIPEAWITQVRQGYSRVGAFRGWQIAAQQRHQAGAQAQQVHGSPARGSCRA